MNTKENIYKDYFEHLSNISLLGRVYKGCISSPLLFLNARRFGPRIVEVGCGTGRGLLGAFSSNVVGLDVNPYAIDFCTNRGLTAHLIHDGSSFPISDSSFDSCVLDNVLEHIEDCQSTLDECWRVTKSNGGLVIAVPGKRGFEYDSDHKVFYEEEKLRNLDQRWKLINLFAMPSFFISRSLSESMRQYCLVAVYKKVN